MSITDDERQKLYQAATQVAKNAYAPYSGSRVGAAVFGKGSCSK